MNVVCCSCVWRFKGYHIPVPSSTSHKFDCQWQRLSQFLQHSKEGWKLSDNKNSNTTDILFISMEQILQFSNCQKIYKANMKVSHSLVAVGAVGLEIHCILGTAYERRSPPVSFRSPIRHSYTFTAGLNEKFQIVGWPYPGLISRPSGDLLYHNRVALTTRSRRVSIKSHKFYTTS